MKQIEPQMKKPQSLHMLIRHIVVSLMVSYILCELSTALCRFNSVMFPFFTPRKERGFLMFSGDIQRDQWHEMG